MPAARTTVAQRSTSLRTSRASASGPCASGAAGMEPSCSIRARMAGSLIAARSAASRRATTGAGVPRGANTAFQPWKM